MLSCKFRCEASKEPSEEVEIGKLLCPREMEYEGRQINEAITGKGSSVVSA